MLLIASTLSCGAAPISYRGLSSPRNHEGVVVHHLRSFMKHVRVKVSLSASQEFGCMYHGRCFFAHKSFDTTVHCDTAVADAADARSLPVPSLMPLILLILIRNCHFFSRENAKNFAYSPRAIPFLSPACVLCCTVLCCTVLC